VNAIGVVEKTVSNARLAGGTAEEKEMSSGNPLLMMRTRVLSSVVTLY
jgi:hypothetical protein